MAKKSKNKTSKGWISKVINHIQSKLRGDKEYWAPVAIALGFTAVFDSAKVLLTCINSITNIECASLIAGLILIALGILIKPRNDQKFWSRIFITGGFAFFFLGIRIEPSSQITGWSIIVSALIFLVVGYRLAPR